MLLLVGPEGLRLGAGWVDPDGVWECWGRWKSVREARGVTTEGSSEHGVASGAMLCGLAEVDLGGG